MEGGRGDLFCWDWGNDKATLKTLSKNGKASFNFTNKIQKSFGVLFASHLEVVKWETERFKNNVIIRRENRHPCLTVAIDCVEP